MKKTHITFTFSLIAAASLALASDTEKRTQIENRIVQLNDEIRLIDIELEKYVTDKPERCREGRNLLGARAMRCNILESKQQELESLTENR